MRKVKTESVTLVYQCPECGHKWRQPLQEIVQAGTVVCPDCDEDCDLTDDVEVNPSDE